LHGTADIVNYTIKDTIIHLNMHTIIHLK